MAKQEGKIKSKKRSFSDSHNTIVISVSSASEISNFAGLKKQQWGPQPDRKRFPDSQNMVVFCVSSDSENDNFSGLRKQRRGPQSDGKSFKRQMWAPQSEVAENSPGTASHSSDGFIPAWFFCTPSDLAAVRTEMLTSFSSWEWGPKQLYSTARFDGEIQWLRVPHSDDDLADTACSKLRADVDPYSDDDNTEKRLLQEDAVLSSIGSCSA